MQLQPYFARETRGSPLGEGPAWPAKGPGVAGLQRRSQIVCERGDEMRGTRISLIVAVAAAACVAGAKSYPTRPVRGRSTRWVGRRPPVRGRGCHRK
jgi:hypothetical protein